MGAQTYSLGPVARSTDTRPCTNRPINCPVKDCPHTIWSYSIEAHYEAAHKGHEKPTLQLAYHEKEMVKQLLSRQVPKKQCPGASCPCKRQRVA